MEQLNCWRQEFEYDREMFLFVFSGKNLFLTRKACWWKDTVHSHFKSLELELIHHPRPLNLLELIGTQWNWYTTSVCAIWTCCKYGNAFVEELLCSLNTLPAPKMQYFAQCFVFVLTSKIGLFWKTLVNELQILNKRTLRVSRLKV